MRHKPHIEQNNEEAVDISQFNAAVIWQWDLPDNIAVEGLVRHDVVEQRLSLGLLLARW